MGWFTDAVTDLVTGSVCVGCERPGRLLCPACRASLPGAAHPAWPSPAPPGLAAPFAAADYDGLVRSAVLGLKEHHLLGLAAPLGGLLAASVRAAAAGTAGPVVLVPVPSRPGTARTRGHDHADALVRAAVALLRREGHDVRRHRLLRHRGGVVDQAGLDASARAENLAGALHCPVRAVRRLRAVGPCAHVVICDDVLTTGATAREAQRALEASGVPVLAVAAVAATRRRNRPAAVVGTDM